jgi:hypothetical protein
MESNQSIRERSVKERRTQGRRTEHSHQSLNQYLPLIESELRQFYCRLLDKQGGVGFLDAKVIEQKKDERLSPDFGNSNLLLI